MKRKEKNKGGKKTNKQTRKVKTKKTKKKAFWDLFSVSTKTWFGLWLICLTVNQLFMGYLIPKLIHFQIFLIAFFLFVYNHLYRFKYSYQIGLVSFV